MLNLYRENSRPFAAAPLDATTSADVVIIGGGYTGLSTALRLAERGVKPAVLESGPIAAGCSGRNGGQVNPGLKLSPDEVEAFCGPVLGPRMVALSYGAPDVVFDLIERHNIDCAPRRTGTIRAALDTRGEADVRALAAQCIQRGGPVRVLGASEMREVTGASVYRAGLMDMRGGHVNPLAYAHGLAAAAKAAGARLYADSRALSVLREGTGWLVRTKAGSVVAAEIVVATNGYTDDLWPGLRRVIAPVYTYMAATDPLPPKLAHSIMPCGSALYEAHWDVVYYRLDDRGRLIMGGRGPQRDLRGTHDVSHLKAYALKLWPDLAGIAWPWRWHGQVAITQDKLPQLIAPERGVHLMLGYNGRGIAMATVAGGLIAERITSGDTAAIPFPVKEKLRFMRFQRFWRLGAEATILKGRLADSLNGR